MRIISQESFLELGQEQEQEQRRCCYHVSFYPFDMSSFIQDHTGIDINNKINGTCVTSAVEQWRAMREMVSRPPLLPKILLWFLSLSSSSQNLQF